MSEGGSTVTMSDKPFVTIIGRGHSGTRAMSHTLTASGVFMGAPLNPMGDLLPPEDMYTACCVLAGYVQWRGGLEWDWTGLHAMDIPTEFTRLIERYLVSVTASRAEHTGWKIPETTLAFPWIAHVSRDALHLLDPRPARLCFGRSQDGRLE